MICKKQFAAVFDSIILLDLKQTWNRVFVNCIKNNKYLNSNQVTLASPNFHLSKAIQFHCPKLHFSLRYPYYLRSTELLHVNDELPEMSRTFTLPIFPPPVCSTTSFTAFFSRSYTLI